MPVVKVYFVLQGIGEDYRGQQITPTPRDIASSISTLRDLDLTEGEFYETPIPSQTTSRESSPTVHQLHNTGIQKIDVLVYV